jgi:hypothetical protein
VQCGLGLSVIGDRVSSKNRGVLNLPALYGQQLNFNLEM